MNRAQIIVKDLILFGYHGVYSEESVHGTSFKLSLVADLSDRVRGFETDNIADTVNYEEIVALMQMYVAQRRYNLVERLSQVIAESILALPNIEAVDLTVEKRVEGLTPEAQWIGVRRMLSRESEG